MQAQQKLFIIALAAVVVVFIGIMAIAYASLFPHFKEIGDWMVWLVRLLIVCAGALAAAGAWFKIVSMHHESQVVQRGDVVLHHGRTKPYVVSADHEAAKVIPQVAISKQETELLPSEAWVVLDMHWQGIGFKRIAEATRWTEYEVRKLCNRVDAGKKGKQVAVDVTQDE